MLSLERCRALLPNDQGLSDDEVLDLRDRLYDLAEIAIDHLPEVGKLRRRATTSPERSMELGAGCSPTLPPLAEAAAGVDCMQRGTWADLEEFETWRFDLAESDDEYILDELANMFPHRWDNQWAASHQGIRMTSGCASHEKWEITTEVKLAKSINDNLEFRYHFQTN